MSSAAAATRKAPATIRSHRFPIRVYYEDTDAAGIVYYANYLKFAERARTEWLRETGHEHATLMKERGLAFAVRRCNVDYLKPARLDDLLEVETRLLAFGAATLDALQIVRRDGVTLAELRIQLACLGPEGRPARLPESVRAALADFVQPEEQA
jgi:acyl-CoA thioester hydrolase